MSKTVKSLIDQRRTVQNFPTFVAPLEIDLENSTHYFIPPSQTIRAMMKNRKIVKSILRNKNFQNKTFDKHFSKVFCSIKDGKMFCDQNDKKELHIMLFIDDANFSSANFRNVKHKITAITMNIEEIDFEITKSAHEMDLVVITYTDFIKKEGALEMVMKAIVEDMLILMREGIVATLDGKEYQFFPKIKSICGDNLAKPMLSQLNSVSSSRANIS